VAYEITDIDVLMVTARSALNLAYQYLSRVLEKPTCLVELSGIDLIGLLLKYPLAFNEIIYAFASTQRNQYFTYILNIHHH
jgi:leucyl-tRNA synthetase